MTTDVNTISGISFPISGYGYNTTLNLFPYQPTTTIPRTGYYVQPSHITPGSSPTTEEQWASLMEYMKVIAEDEDFRVAKRKWEKYFGL